MNKVLVVDDEKLVRQGIITTFPWGKHGFEVAGDAGSGEKALEILGESEIDLLVTDLAMNGMSGLDLIREARKRKRDLPVVILTCHDNFKYIQEAMRLGVLDYIVKTEIEDEIVDETLTRIAEKLSQRRRPRQESGVGIMPKEAADEGLLLCGPSRLSLPLELLGRDESEAWAQRLTDVDTATWLLRVSPDEADRLLERIGPELAAKGWRCVRIHGLGAPGDSEALTALRRYRRQTLFYRPSDAAVDALDWADIAGAPDPDDGAWAPIAAAWSGPGWVYSDDKFESLLRLTEAAGVGSNELRNAFYPVALEWDRLLGIGAVKELLDAADDWQYWRDWDSWIRGFRRQIRRTVDKNATRQIADAILQAIELLRSAHDPEAGEADIARAVNMSRGHFSKSFKKVTGKSYGDYVRQLKLERAKEMILRTDEPITRVAELCGFSDYRHFSRVFRDHTGMLPTEYRRTGMQA